MTANAFAIATESTIGPWQNMLVRARRAMASAREIVVPTGQVQAMRGQPRVYFNPESLQRLAESLRSVGQLYPGIVRAIPARGVTRFELLDGERRWRAAKLAKMDYRALLVEIDDEAAAFLIAAVANFNRESHTPLEVSDAIAHMRDLGMPMPEIAAALGLSEVWAIQMHSLHRLLPDVRVLMDPMLPKDRILPTMAAIQLAKVDPSLQLPLAKRLLEKKVTLNNLRTEAIRVSREAGKPTRMHEIKPRNRWRTLGHRSDHLTRIANDTLAMLGDVDDTREILRGRAPAQIRKICESLRAAATSASRAAKRLEAEL